jgi:hypothetical protein
MAGSAGSRSPTVISSSSSASAIRARTVSAALSRLMPATAGAVNAGCASSTCSVMATDYAKHCLIRSS